jgi:gamma-glutamyl hydrolase
MKRSILLLTVYLASAALATTGTEIPMIGVIAQPASNHLDNEYFHAQNHWNYIPRSYVDWVSHSGAMPVLIPFDIPLDALDHLLDSIQGVLFPGGGSALFDEHGHPTLFQQRTKHIMDFAQKKNDNGVYYPIIGTCFGFQSMVIAMADQDPDLLSCNFGDEETYHAVEKTSDWSKGTFWKTMDQTLVDSALKTGHLYYSHNCGFRVSSLTNSRAFRNNAYILGTSVSKTGKEFVGMVEHKHYPFVANQYHPEKTQFERLGATFLPRDPITMQFVSEFIMTIVDHTRPFSKNIGDVDGSIKAYWEIYHTPERPAWDYFEQIYTMPRHEFMTMQRREDMREYESADEQARLRSMRAALKKKLGKMGDDLDNFSFVQN